jgi:hypothetical protein
MKTLTIETEGSNATILSLGKRSRSCLEFRTFWSRKAKSVVFWLPLAHVGDIPSQPWHYPPAAGTRGYRMNLSEPRCSRRRTAAFRLLADLRPKSPPAEALPILRPISPVFGRKSAEELRAARTNEFSSKC